MSWRLARLHIYFSPPPLVYFTLISYCRLLDDDDGALLSYFRRRLPDAALLRI